MDRATFANALRESTPLVGGWSTTADPVLLEVLAGEGFDFVVIDGEHSENTIADLAAGVRAIDAAGRDGTQSVVRVSGADRAEIRRVLDFGPSGVLIPQIESLDEARAAVAATAYPPAGVRGVAGGRASGYGTDLAAAVATDDERLATILQIETEGALDDVEDVVDLDGLDALFVGPADLSARLGVFGEFESATFRDAVGRIVAAANDAGVPVGTLATSPEQVQTRWQDWGVDFLVAGTDLRYVRDGVAGYLDAVEDV
jgi:2-dehydro-3-deoxyglucarate aldolase/4-hydroxy-2-oxoheptanedioate aldolase